MTEERDLGGSPETSEKRVNAGLEPYSGGAGHRASGGAVSTVGGLYGWRLALLLLCAALALTLGLYGASAASAVDLWWNRSSYNHGFLVIPISLYLVWDKHEALAAMTPRPSVGGLLVIAGFSLAWTICRSAGINEGEHFALVGVIQGVVLAVLGRQVFLSMILPMTYLWLMVPTGTVLYPILQGAAHWQTVAMLQLSGIPVFGDGFFVQVPTGLYEVAEGCSGLNFILAGLALAPLFGYMMYDGMRKRLIAIGAMLVIGVVANGIRIYAIIALAEFSNRRIDIVDDHLLYGWGFFAMVLVIAGFVGSRFADPERPARTEPYQPAAHIDRKFLVTGAALAMIVLALLPLYRLAAVTSGSGPGSGPGAGHIDLAGLQLETVAEAGDGWLPDFPRATKTLQVQASRHNVTADVYLAGYFNPRDASEMITSGNDLAGSSAYQTLGGFSRQIASADGTVSWRFVQLGSRSGARLVAQARQVDGAFVTSALKAKLLQAKATLLWSKKSSGVILVSVPITVDFEKAEGDLTRFIEGADLTGLFAARPDRSTPPQSGER